ncbi:MAG: Gfo/Idh/MocA family oxidoreductase [Planctomycetia bacterium]|nr:Gfo/Idh/MocA family oxidoreductase [Planctomycetia bacterium]
MHTFSRRSFLKKSAILSGLAAVNVSVPAFCADAASSSKLNIAVIGPCNRGGANLSGVLQENILGICDVDSRYLEQAGKRVPKAARFEDFRIMLEKLEKDLDAVVVSTPDHTHAVCAVMAMRMGKHCYCEKPLAHDVRECRVMQQIAAEKKLVTQMGTQIHAGENYRRVVEWVQSGAIGKIREVYSWLSGGRFSYTERPAAEPVPEYLNWDLWLGPVPECEYSSCYHPGGWRRFWDFGNGTFGDFGCHYMDLPFWALGLQDCLTVEANGPKPNPIGCPGQITVKYTFPARGDLPPVTLTWYNGQMPPILAEKKIPNPPGAGNLFIGEKGMILANYEMHRLLPEADFADYPRPEQTIPSSVGHHAEWIQACKENNPAATTCRFGYSGRLSETVLLGNVAFRSGKKLEWDAENMKITNAPEANAYLEREYRDGWIL